MNPRILIIDDEPLIALDFEVSLREEGFEVVGIARDESSALEYIDNTDLDFVVLDADLNGVSGERVAERLREVDLPYAVVTGYSARQLDWLNGATLIQKPADHKKLISEIRLKTNNR